MTSSERACFTVIAVTALTAGVLAHMGAGYTSATFDEIVLVSGGLRGIEEQRWDMVTDQLVPPLRRSSALAPRGTTPAPRASVLALPRCSWRWETMPTRVAFTLDWRLVKPVAAPRVLIMLKRARHARRYRCGVALG